MKLLRRVVALVAAFAASTSFASTSGLVVSQVYGGGGNSGATLTNDFIEIFNAGDAAISVTGFSVQYASATGTTWQVTTLSGTVPAGGYYLIKEAAGAGGTVPLPTADATGSIAMSATAAKVALVSTTTALTGAAPTANVVDIVSYGASTPTEGTPVATLANTTAASRNGSGCTDTNDNASDFTVGAPAPRNATTPVHVCSANAPIVTACAPFTVVAGSGGTGTETASDVDGTVNGATLATQTAGIALGAVTPAGGPGGSATVQVVVSASVPSGTYPFALTFTNDQSQTATCTTSVTAGALTPTYAIQGSGATSPLVGRSVITQGVVTRVDNNGFFLQDPVGDGDDATSDGIFVFTSSAPTVRAGDLARVSGTVAEFNTGAATNADTASHTVTELSSVGSVSVIGSGYSIAPLVVPFPLANRDDLERYEGMLVTLTGPLTVAENYFVGQYGQVTAGRARPGRDADEPSASRCGGAGAVRRQQAAQHRPRGRHDGAGPEPDAVPVAARPHAARRRHGAVDHRRHRLRPRDEQQHRPGRWRIVPTIAPTFTRANPRTASPDDVGGTIRVGSGNVENFFTTFTNGQTATAARARCTVGASTARRTAAAPTTWPSSCASARRSSRSSSA